MAMSAAMRKKQNAERAARKKRNEEKRKAAGTRKPKSGIEPQAAASGYAVDIPKSQRDLASAYKKHGAGLEAFEQESLARFRKKGAVKKKAVKKKAVKKKATAKKETPTKRYRRQRRRAPGRVR